MKVRTLLAAGLVATLIADAADAKPRRTSEAVAYGFMAEVKGSGCSPSTLPRPVAGSAPIRFAPGVGEVFGLGTAVGVADARLEAGQASWTIAPRWYECDLHAGDPAWAWETERRAWAVTYEASTHAIRSHRWDGVRSIAGFRVAPRGRRYAPTLRRARRALGRPSSVRPGRRQREICRVEWRRLGLKLVFANFGLGGPCRRGLAQYGSVRGEGAAEWTAVIGRNAGVTVGTEEGYLAEALIGDPDPAAPAWVLAETYVPYGGGGDVPTVRALIDRAGRVHGFDFWIGAAGD